MRRNGEALGGFHGGLLDPIEKGITTDGNPPSIKANEYAQTFPDIIRDPHNGLCARVFICPYAGDIRDLGVPDYDRQAPVK